jgi:hypothetical protein
MFLKVAVISSESVNDHMFVQFSIMKTEQVGPEVALWSCIQEILA